jgi:hypothetical protein
MSEAIYSLPSYAFMACIRTLLLRQVIILNSTQIRVRNGECLVKRLPTTKLQNPTKNLLF